MKFNKMMNFCFSLFILVFIVVIISSLGNSADILATTPSEIVGSEFLWSVTWSVLPISLIFVIYNLIILIRDSSDLDKINKNNPK